MSKYIEWAGDRPRCVTCKKSIFIYEFWPDGRLSCKTCKTRVDLDWSPEEAARFRHWVRVAAPTKRLA